MAHLLRGKQAGVQNDFTAGLSPDQINIDEIQRYGVGSQISQIAYDPVQGLIAVGTNDTQFGPGQIYVFGQRRVDVVLNLSRKGSVRILQFCADKLICLDSRNELSIFSLETKRLVAAYTPPGAVVSVYTDPAIDFALLGMQNGEVLAYDLDREAMAPFRIPNLWREKNPKARLSPVITLRLHPRDIGALLIGYAEGAVIYSFNQSKAVRFFYYELPRGAPGGDLDPTAMNIVRRPQLTHAVWHPTGTFILTGHADGSLVFWDAKDGRIVMARTLDATNINQPLRNPGSSISDGMGAQEPITEIIWCANQDPDDTAILISGGTSSMMPTKGLTLFELGRTPNYSTSSWPVLAAHFESPKRQRLLPTPPNASVQHICLVPRSSPHFHGAQDPLAILALLASGELISLSFPSGIPISATNQLHVSLSFVHPFVTAVNLAPVDRNRWLGMTEKRSRGPPMLRGGKEQMRPLKRFEHRNVVQTAHADGTVRVWDAGHGDELENDGVVQADVGRAVGRMDDVEVVVTSLAGATGELAAGLKSGEVVVFRWNSNKHPGREGRGGENKARGLTDVLDRCDPALSEGLLPLTLFDGRDGRVTALELSDVGFVAAAFEGGSMVVIDLRGPAVIFDAKLTELVRQDRKSSFRRHSQQPATADWATKLVFSVMTLDQESYSSILLHAGTHHGHLLTLQIVPDASGRYSVHPAGHLSLDSPVVSISPLHANTGSPALATQSAVAGLRNGAKTPGVLLVVTQGGARLFRPATSKGASKSWDDFYVYSAAVARWDEGKWALVCLCGDGVARVYSIPALKEVGGVRVGNVLDVKRMGQACVTRTGDVLGWTGPSEMALLTVFGSGLPLDVIFDPEALIPPRPTISNLQWISGTQHVTPSDIDILIGGPDRPPSRRMVAQARADQEAARSATRNRAAAATLPTNQNDEGYWEYMQRQINERTEKLGIVGDSVNRLEETSAGWADDVSKYVQRQKRNMVMGGEYIP
ncbi:hypothetical protein P152DRAFT_489794 [Eremomyces bilateralis CBS 781.70]|uniref:Lethal giant larvae (Lgl)-like C-terminal domain-containing protein n=1 Tax=Eremomyces bilateralis CBS 781.70 TaxID=1392243 RepID=A0A6G1G012_9PEZI|nr:uncharacterized protein P152DRAFT_489794 [Eremomyces bilateralis CBS 781.70]KAF1811358.1 hypothetical protein P152DRAFT_489794 [Eremomyces bilateralis CBS 781.70]